jgi:hypothetical protein
MVAGPIPGSPLVQTAGAAVPHPGPARMNFPSARGIPMESITIPLTSPNPTGENQPGMEVEMKVEVRRRLLRNS